MVLGIIWNRKTESPSNSFFSSELIKVKNKINLPHRVLLGHVLGPVPDFITYPPIFLKINNKNDGVNTWKI